MNTNIGDVGKSPLPSTRTCIDLEYRQMFFLYCESNGKDGFGNEELAMDIGLEYQTLL
jgi:hypothetical protein